MNNNESLGFKMAKKLCSLPTGSFEVETPRGVLKVFINVIEKYRDNNLRRDQVVVSIYDSNNTLISEISLNSGADNTPYGWHHFKENIPHISNDTKPIKSMLTFDYSQTRKGEETRQIIFIKKGITYRISDDGLLVLPINKSYKVVDGILYYDSDEDFNLAFDLENNQLCIGVKRNRRVNSKFEELADWLGSNVVIAIKDEYDINSSINRYNEFIRQKTNEIAHELKEQFKGNAGSDITSILGLIPELILPLPKNKTIFKDDVKIIEALAKIYKKGISILDSSYHDPSTIKAIMLAADNYAREMKAQEIKNEIREMQNQMR